MKSDEPFFCCKISKIKSCTFWVSRGGRMRAGPAIERQMLWGQGLLHKRVACQLSLPGHLFLTAVEPGIHILLEPAP